MCTTNVVFSLCLCFTRVIVWLICRRSAHPSTMFSTVSTRHSQNATRTWTGSATFSTRTSLNSVKRSRRSRGSHRSVQYHVTTLLEAGYRNYDLTIFVCQCEHPWDFTYNMHIPMKLPIDYLQIPMSNMLYYLHELVMIKCQLFSIFAAKTSGYDTFQKNSKNMNMIQWNSIRCEHILWHINLVAYIINVTD